MIRTILKVLLPLVTLVVGFLVLGALVKTKPDAAKAATQPKAPIVEVAPVKAERRKVTVRAQGTVMALREVALQPEVSGRVVWVHPQMIAGGRVQEGEPLVRLDGGDFQMAVRQREADVERARMELELERGRQTLARKEWEQLAGSLESTEEGKAVALRVPQERNAKASLSGAESGLSLARRNLARAELRAPYSALVLNESVEVGQIITPQSRVATLVDSGRFQVVVNLPLNELSWFDIPGITANVQEGASARVIQETGGEPLVRQGRVARLLGDLDPAGKMARVVVEVDDPLRLKEGGGFPLLLGGLVRVEIEGKEVEGVVEVPRKAVRDGGSVWALTPEGSLDIIPVEIVWEDPDHVLVKGVPPDARLITSRLAIPVKGMKLRLSEEGGSSNKTLAPTPKDAPQGGKP